MAKRTRGLARFLTIGVAGAFVLAPALTVAADDTVDVEVTVTGPAELLGAVTVGLIDHDGAPVAATCTHSLAGGPLIVRCEHLPFGDYSPVVMAPAGIEGNASCGTVATVDPSEPPADGSESTPSIIAFTSCSMVVWAEGDEPVEPGDGTGEPGGDPGDDPTGPPIDPGDDPVEPPIVPGDDPAVPGDDPAPVLGDSESLAPTAEGDLPVTGDASLLLAVMAVTLVLVGAGLSTLARRPVR